MQVDPVSERLRLTAQYREMSDDELRELAADLSDLTETAQQVLRDEMRSRGLGEPEAATLMPAASNASLAALVAHSAGPSIDDPAVNPLIALGQAPELVPDAPDATDEGDGPVEYTWKTVLCECDTDDQAKQLREVLSQAGIETWFNFGGYTTSIVPSISQSLQTGGIQVLVAADQLDQARAIAAQPIPQDIVEESETTVPDYLPPKCPKCGAADPILEGVDPSNSWRCDQCRERWSDPVPKDGQTTPEPSQNPL